VTLARPLRDPRSRLLTAAGLLGLALATVLSHFPLIRAGFGFMDSDDATIPLVTTLFRRGEWSPFYLQQPYGGTILTAVRALLISLWEAISNDPRDYVLSQATFSFAVIPVLMVWAVFFVVRAYCSTRAAWLVALVSAMGLTFWTQELFERDFYSAYVLLGFAILTLRARFTDPLNELGGRGLFAVGALCGFALYTCRASAIFVVAFFATEKDIGHWAKRFWEPRTRADRILRGAVAFLIGLFAYITLFGRDLWTVFGKPVRVDAFPNLKLAALLFAAWFAKEWLRSSTPRQRRGMALLGAGAVVGMLPEILFLLRHHVGAALISTRIGTWKEVIQTLGSFPEKISEAADARVSLTRHATLLLLIASAWVFARASLRDERLKIIRFTAILSLIAFLVVFQTAIGEVRYLLPLSPVVAVMLGVLADWGLKHPSRWPRFALIALAILHSTHQISGNISRAQAALEPDPEATAREIVQAFRAEGLKLVIADDYWESNQYTFISRWDPFFISNGRRLGIEEAFLLQDSETRVGILLANQTCSESPNEIKLGRYVWMSRFLKQSGNRCLRIGEKLRPREKT
jgi:hypothetical protein